MKWKFQISKFCTSKYGRILCPILFTFFTQCAIICQNPMKDGVAFSGFSACPLPYLRCCLQNAITFFLCGLCWVWKGMRDKSFHFLCFPKKNWSLSVSSFSQKNRLFCPKSHTLVGNRQTKFKKKMKSLNVSYAFSIAVLKAPNLTESWSSNTRPWLGKRRIFLIFPFQKKKRNFSLTWHFKKQG